MPEVYYCFIDAAVSGFNIQWIQTIFSGITVQRVDSLIGYLLVGYALDRLGKLSSDRLGIVRSTSGKPYFSRLPLQFNISHSGMLIACVVDDFSVGIDVQVHENKIYNPVFENFFTIKELDEFNDPDSFSHKFSRLWTMKESYLKMLGTGLQKPLRSFTIHLYGANFAWALDTPQQVNAIRTVTIHDQYELSVCSARNFFSLQMCPVTLNQLENWYNRF